MRTKVCLKGAVMLPGECQQPLKPKEGEEEEEELATGFRGGRDRQRYG